MTRLVMASTLYGAATAVAAIDADPLPVEEQVLVIANTGVVPETTHPFTDTPGFAALRESFDRIVSWNDVVAPYHPSIWAPRRQDRRLWRRLLMRAWELDRPPSRIVLESLAVAPARTVAEIFEDTPLSCYADGLMAYGPTRNRLPTELGGRVTELLYPDLLPGVTPLLLSEHRVPSARIETSALSRVHDRIAVELPATPEPALDLAPTRPALVVGQYLSALGIVTPEQEGLLHAEMLDAVVAAGHESVVFAPHPLAPRALTEPMTLAARRYGITFATTSTPIPAESLVRRLQPRLVVGCFSTALATARLAGAPVATLGTEPVLAALTPYQNSNRVPASLVDATVPSLVGSSELLDRTLVPELLTAVGYCMQPRTYPHLRDRAAEFLDWHLDERTARYFRRRRLTALGLPGRDGWHRRALARRRTPGQLVRRRSAAVAWASRGLVRAVVRG